MLKIVLALPEISDKLEVKDEGMDRRRYMTKSGIEKLATIESRDIALKHGYKALTVSYNKNELWALTNICADMRRGKIDFCLVQPDLLKEEWELWRKGITSEKEFIEIQKSKLINES